MKIRTRESGHLTLHLTGPSLASRLPGVRRRIAAWAGALGMASETVEDLVLATHEALANVADHAYPDGDGEAWVEALCQPPGMLTVVVRDRGRWRPPPEDPGRRGHGMAIIRGLAERVVIRRGDLGTTVEMRWMLA